MKKALDKCYATLEEAQQKAGEKDNVFYVTDPANPQRAAYVVAKSHPLARAAAALQWGMSCKTVSGKRSPTDVMASIAVMTPEERQKVAAVLQSLDTVANDPYRVVALANLTAKGIETPDDRTIEREITRIRGKRPAAAV